jgi:iron complex outermembrane receptor protein
MRFSHLFAFATLLLYGSHAAAADSVVLEEVVVTATLREQSLLDAPVSITVLNERTLQDAGRQHFEDVLAAVPNLNWAGGTSRPRFFQIRGIGEREQYEGAPNPSVGFLIDDIDFSGIGMPATLFDLERIEVLRGPQGMRYGANALAGLIVMRSQDPADELGFATEASYGEYASESVGAVASLCSVIAATVIAATYSCIATTRTIATSSRAARSGAGSRATTRRSI